MVKVSENRHKRSLDFGNERKVVIMRDQGYSFPKIQVKVVNNMKKMPGLRTVADTYYNFKRRGAQRVFQYFKCGRKPWKVTPEIDAFLLSSMLKLRKVLYCTSTTLQSLTAREHGVDLSVKSIQRCLRKHGYRWLKKSQKRLYSPEDKKLRLTFAGFLDGLSEAQYQEEVSYSMDGVVLGMSPTTPIERHNFCHGDEDHIWRKTSEYAIPELAGNDDMPKQIPLNRSVPFWGGIGALGASVVCFHEGKKIDPDEWVDALEDGCLNDALDTAAFPSSDGTYTVISDNETFLKNPEATRNYRLCGVKLWHIPPRSPDLNPVERFWNWVRKEMRKKDLEDLRAKRQVIGKTAYKQRLRALLRSRRAQVVAKNNFNSLVKTCALVVKRKGANSRG